MPVGKGKISPAIHELAKMLYKIEEIDKSKLNEENKVKYMIKGVLPYLSELLKNYKDFVHRLSQDYKNAFYGVYFSLKGKHGHYNIKRMLREFRNLKNSITGIMKMYQV
jgi:hypothetical protein